ACPPILAGRSRLVKLRFPPAAPDAAHPLNYTRALSEIFSPASMPVRPAEFYNLQSCSATVPY
ncbi:MAG: hypothetical protein MUP90_00020, partial [Gammaproteobacteria bacterium]|nr:hypothetical protein [Gammaproteobacteria bacterium]